MWERRVYNMFEIFGNFDSAADINQKAVSLRKEGDKDSIYKLAEENGVPQVIAEAFANGEMIYLVDDTMAAIGKIEVEAKELNPVEIMADWVNYLKGKCFEERSIARAVRRKNKNLKEAIGELLAWGVEHQEPVNKDILKAANIKARDYTLGIPGMNQAKQILAKYYLEE